MSTLLTFLAQPTTRWSIGVPFALIAALCAYEAKKGAPLDKDVLAVCLGLLPISYLLSWWTGGSFHVVSLFLLTLPFWIGSKRITLAQSVTLTFMHTPWWSTWWPATSTT
ncbi:hypothetical protein [Ramlibacter alkalitolerans]|uniref:Uncharacterized protein n=1 Tax=Ramlibacter alkalitolerans TaxID=2039631 RepID=A0ABS1JTZ7_9BURK|nr:hypothetical protein [Ramlibacter alkalitolerans]MBL0427693.1 hypothetical protein [Ramlibacter alkalitolerans]